MNLETPVRGIHQQQQQQLGNGSSEYSTPLLDSILRPKRLFTTGQSPTGGSITKRPLLGDHHRHQQQQQQQQQSSPARSILDSARRENGYVNNIEALKRATEKAKFELKQVELERERDREEALRIKQSLESELLAQTKRVEKLERDRKWLFDQEEKLAEQRRDMERDMIKQKERFDAKIEKVVGEYRQREQQLDEVTRAFRRLKNEHVEEIEDLQIKLARAERNAKDMRLKLEASSGNSSEDALLQHTIDTLRRELQEKGEHIVSLQRQLRRERSDSSNNEQGGDDDNVTLPQDRIAQLERDLHEQCAYIKAVEQQNSHLRAEVQQLGEMASHYEQEREVTQALQSKIQRLEEQQENYIDLEAQFNVLQQEREQWRKVFQGSEAYNNKENGNQDTASQPISNDNDNDNDSSKDVSHKKAIESPYAVAKTVASQRHKISLLETKIETLQDKVDSTTLELQTMAREASTYKKDCTRLEEEVSAERRRIIQLERSKQYSMREAEFLRSQLHSYDSEEANMMDGNYDAQKAERIKQLELFIDEQREWISKLDAGDNTLVGDATQSISSSVLQNYREEAEAKERELEAAKEEHQQLLKRFEALEKEAARLEHQVGSGLGYNPRTTRILQLIDNPSAQDYAIRSEKLKALVAENEALLAHIKKLEENSGQSAEPMVTDDGDGEPSTDSPFFHTINNLQAENQNLTKQLEDSGKLMRRYKKEWKKKAAELREVVYSILGYRVDFLSNGGVRFTSTYASDVDQSFVFISGDDNQGVMKLSGGGNKSYLKGLSNDIRYWVQERGSIPGFMSTVTLQSFEANHTSQPL
ncbi:coiled-coil domain-containing protein mad1 [Dipsacomyces acuminosporus]|nr:coiled-coil domain-containing protein mad1 [Dipsacomyces acuminosporus]